MDRNELKEKLAQAREIYLREHIPLVDLAKRMGISKKEIYAASTTEGWVQQKRTSCKLDVPEEFARIREKYIHGEISLPALAEEEGVPLNRLYVCSRQGHWGTERDMYRTANGMKPLMMKALTEDEKALIEKVHQAYLAGEGTVKALAKKYGARYNYIKFISAAENWPLEASKLASAKGEKRAYINHSRDWTTIKEDYITCDLSPEEFAPKYGITPMLLRHHIIKGSWDEERIAYRTELREKLQAHIMKGSDAAELTGTAVETKMQPEPYVQFPKEAIGQIRNTRMKKHYEIRMDYITGTKGIHELAEKYGVPYSTLRKTSVCEKWTRFRAEYRKQHFAQIRKISMDTEIAVKMHIRRRAEEMLNGVDETIADIRKRVGTPDEWKALVETLERMENLDRRTSGRLTAAEEHRQLMDLEEIDLRRQKNDDDYALAQEKVKAEREIRHEEAELKRRQIELAERALTEKNAPPKPIPVYWGDPEMEECAR